MTKRIKGFREKGKWNTDQYRKLYSATFHLLNKANKLVNLSISGQTHEFIIYAMCQRARADDLTICQFVVKKQIEVSFSCLCLVIENEFRYNIVKVVCGSSRLSPLGSTTTLTISWQNPWSITGQTHEKTNLDFLNRIYWDRFLLRPRTFYLRGIWKFCVLSSVWPTSQTSPSRKRSFPKTLFEPEELENAGCSYSYGRKTFPIRSLSKTMTST